MSGSSARGSVAIAIAAYNLIQNRLLPASLYVPANVAVAGALIALARSGGCSWSDLGLDPRQVREGGRNGLLVAGPVVLLGAGSVSHPGARRRLLDERAAGQDRGDILYNTLVRLPLGTALFEEVVFRGVVEGVWAREGSTEAEAAVAAAVLFGLWHLIPTSDALGGNPVSDMLDTPASRTGGVIAGSVATGLASLGLSWLRNRSGSLVAPWLAHTAISCTGYLAGVAAWRSHSRG